MPSYVTLKGLATDHRAFRCNMYSLAGGAALVLAGIPFLESKYLLVYLSAVTLIPVSSMLFIAVRGARCRKLSKTIPKEYIVVAMNGLLDSAYMLELTPAGKMTVPLTGTDRYAIQDWYMLFLDTAFYSGVLLLTPVIGYFFGGDDANIVALFLSLILMLVFLLVSGMEYYLCFKRGYPADSMIYTAAIVRCPWVSYVEIEIERRR